jgi:hypothetical protein
LWGPQYGTNVNFLFIIRTITKMQHKVKHQTRDWTTKLLSVALCDCPIRDIYNL